MATMRKPYQGVTNIVRFNWHFYVLAIVVTLILISLGSLFQNSFSILLYIISLLVIFITVISLAVSYYIYDASNLFSFNWFDKSQIKSNNKLVNIHAGFDEASEILHGLFPDCALTVLDFYDPQKHTELSIKRARNAYPAYPGTRQIGTTILPIESNSVDYTFLILAAHEIRNNEERLIFFSELNRILKPSGKILVTEHLRDIPNLLAYNVGFFHFISKSIWIKTFENAQLKIKKTIKTTPFITTFILEKNDTAS